MNSVNNAISKYDDKTNYSKKELIKLKKDILYYKKKYNYTTAEYYEYNFKKIGEEKAVKFIGSKERIKYMSKLNIGVVNFTRDKYETYKRYKKFYKRDMVNIDSKDDYKEFCNYCKKHDSFVKKPKCASHGHGVELVNIKGKNTKKLFDDLIEELGSFIIEEPIIQDKRMAKIHPSSVNTLRIVPYVDKDGSVIIHRPFLKVGQGSSFVDNGGAGGILASIDAKTGIVNSNGIDELCKRFDSHPDTNIKFKGFQIPEWDSLIKLFDEIAKVSTNARYLGFDMALSKDGWVVVECNGLTEFIGQQMPLNEGIRDEFEKLIHWDKLKSEE